MWHRIFCPVRKSKGLWRADIFYVNMVSASLNDRKKYDYFSAMGKSRAGKLKLEMLTVISMKN